jgi:hypothetical protein
MLVVSGIWKFNLNHYTVDENAAATQFTGTRDDFEMRYQQLKKKIIEDTTSEEYPILLIAGEGGGSRAGLWFSQNLINFDFATNGSFRDHIFSVSTVSGSSVGLGTVMMFWDKTRLDQTIHEKWKDLPGKVFANNYVGSSIRGLLLTDLYQSLIPGFHGKTIETVHCRMKKHILLS